MSRLGGGCRRCTRADCGNTSGALRDSRSDRRCPLFEVGEGGGEAGEGGGLAGMRTVSFLESDALSVLLEILDLLVIGVTLASCLAYLGVFGGVGSASTRLRFAGVADCARAFRFTPFLHIAISSLCLASSFAILFSALAAFRLTSSSSCLCTSPANDCASPFTHTSNTSPHSLAGTGKSRFKYTDVMGESAPGVPRGDGSG